MFGWTEPQKADMIVHKRKSQVTVTFSEIDSYVVNAYNISNIISDDIFDSTQPSTQGQSKTGAEDNPEGGVKVKKGDGYDDEDSDERIIVVTTKSFSIKIISSSVGQAAEIRQQIFTESVTGGSLAKGTSGAGGTKATGNSVSEEKAIKKTSNL